MFESIIGQELAKKRLKNIIESDRVTNAYIFSGPDGVGKKKMALAFSSILIGVNVENSPDFSLIKSEKDENSIKIEKVRKLNADMGLKPHSDYRIFVIDEAEKMTIQAQNALLKTLEEPATYGIIILVTKNEQSLLETIRSRCVEIKFSPLREGDLSEILYKNGIEKEDMILPMLFSRGSASMALKVAENKSLVEMRKTVESCIKTIIMDKDIFEASRANEYLKSFSDISDIVLEVFKTYFRDSIVYRETSNDRLLINKDKVRFIKKISSDISVSQLGKIIEVLDETEKKIKANGSFGSAIQVMSMNIFKVVNKW